MKSMLLAAALMGIFVLALFSEPPSNTSATETRERYSAPLDIPEVTAFAHRVRMSEIGLLELQQRMPRPQKKEKLPVCVFLTDTAQ